MQIAIGTKNEAIYQNLRQGLLSGDVKPGQRLVLSELASRYNVSPIPVREAIRRLQQEGLVEVIPHIGAIAKSIDLEKYQEIVEVRNLLEVAAASSAASRITPAAVRKLEAMHTKMEKYIGSANMCKFIESDRKFHFAIYDFSANSFLVENVFMLWDRCKISGYILAWGQERALESHQEHSEIIAALKEKNVDLVGQLVRRHKERSLERLRTALNTAK